MHILQQADHADYRGGQHSHSLRLVVERYVATDDGYAQSVAGVGYAADRALHLVEHLRALRVAEVETVGHGQWLGPHARQVARSLGHRVRSPHVRVEVAV